jgi:hypothetical protein
MWGCRNGAAQGVQKMKLNNLGSNKTEISFDNGTVIFFSYNTPVAAFVPGRGYLKTTKRYSVTTSKHVNQWCSEYRGTIEPEELAALAGGK